MSVHTIDCNYIGKDIAAAFLMIEGNEGAFVENNTIHAIPSLLEKLNKENIKLENIRYIIITHVHLDHAGGTSELLSNCPNAVVLAHPKAAPHIIDPKRLIESSMMVYGRENFLKLYGEIKPVPSDRVRIVQDGEIISWGNRILKFIYTRGHANHHFVVHDSKTNGVFTGDSFGIGYKQLQHGNEPFLFPSTTPTDFDFEEAILSIDKIINTGADKVYLTHFGIWTEVASGASQLREGLKKMENIRMEALNSTLSDEELQKFCSLKIGDYFRNELERRNINLKELQFLEFDRDINAMGLAHSAKRQRGKSKI